MQKDPAIFTGLYKEYAAGIYKLCLGYSGDAATAQDLLQETFIRVWNNMQTFREEAKWSTWIYRIAVNTCLSWLRSRQPAPINADHPFIEGMPEEATDGNVQVKLLYTCISTLAPADRLIITLVLEEKPYPEIAAITGITENNLRVKIHRIKKQLSQRYNDYERL
jgi:RNA polymerase sigma-70 factor (ECF subfamily)